ncbi:MAG: hypothetical protein LKF43_03650 [Streptococcaceae bacterium]|jgi:hypothetical protein|nr:hypothetical protein [Streptococcaceae bacterium]
MGNRRNQNAGHYTSQHDEKHFSGDGKTNVDPKDENKTTRTETRGTTNH